MVESVDSVAATLDFDSGADAKVIREGFVRKQNKYGRWQRRWLRLTQHHLTYWHTQPAPHVIGNGTQVARSKGSHTRPEGMSAKAKKELPVVMAVLSIQRVEPSGDKSFTVHFGKEMHVRARLEAAAEQELDTADPPVDACGAPPSSPNALARQVSLQAAITFQAEDSLEQANWIHDVRTINKAAMAGFRADARQRIRMEQFDDVVWTTNRFRVLALVDDKAEREALINDSLSDCFRPSSLSRLDSIDYTHVDFLDDIAAAEQREIERLDDGGELLVRKVHGAMSAAGEWIALVHDAQEETEALRQATSKTSAEDAVQFVVARVHEHVAAIGARLGEELSDCLATYHQLMHRFTAASHPTAAEAAKYTWQEVRPLPPTLSVTLALRSLRWELDAGVAASAAAGLVFERDPFEALNAAVGVDYVLDLATLNDAVVATFEDRLLRLWDLIDRRASAAASDRSWQGAPPPSFGAVLDMCEETIRVVQQASAEPDEGAVGSQPAILARNKSAKFRNAELQSLLGRVVQVCLHTSAERLMRLAEGASTLEAPTIVGAVAAEDAPPPPLLEAVVSAVHRFAGRVVAARDSAHSSHPPAWLEWGQADAVELLLDSCRFVVEQTLPRLTASLVDACVADLEPKWRKLVFRVPRRYPRGFSVESHEWLSGRLMHALLDATDRARAHLTSTLTDAPELASWAAGETTRVLLVLYLQAFFGTPSKLAAEATGATIEGASDGGADAAGGGGEGEGATTTPQRPRNRMKAISKLVLSSVKLTGLDDAGNDGEFDQLAVDRFNGDCAELQLWTAEHAAEGNFPSSTLDLADLYRSSGANPLSGSPPWAAVQKILDWAKLWLSMSSPTIGLENGPAELDQELAETLLEMYVSATSAHGLESSQAFYDALRHCVALRPTVKGSAACMSTRTKWYCLGLASAALRQLRPYAAATTSRDSMEEWWWTEQGDDGGRVNTEFKVLLPRTGSKHCNGDKWALVTPKDEREASTCRDKAFDCLSRHRPALTPEARRRRAAETGAVAADEAATEEAARTKAATAAKARAEAARLAADEAEEELRAAQTPPRPNARPKMAPRAASISAALGQRASARLKRNASARALG